MTSTGRRLAYVSIGFFGCAASVLAAAPADCEHDQAVITAQRGIIFQPATGLIPGQMYWKLVDAAWCDDVTGGFKVNIFYRCLDASGNVIANQACIANYGTTQVTIYTKPAPDWGDFAMSGGNWCPSWPEGGNGPYNAWVAGSPSDRVYGMGLPCNHHESYYLTWQWSQYSSPTEGAIAGMVSNSAGQPINGATVTAQPGGYTGTTGPSGQYSILNVPPGIYSVTASRTGFNPQTRNNVSVSAGATTPLDFTLASSLASISGVVRDAASAPIPWASVKLSPGGYGAVTGADGAYEIIGIPPATYSVTAFAPTRTQQTVAGQVVPPNGSIVVDFSLTGSGRVVHLLDDFNGSYPGYPALEESFKGGILNQFYFRESLPDRVLPPNTGTNSSQGFSVITNNDQYISWFGTKDPVTADSWFNLVSYAAQRGWEQIDLSQPLTYLVYVKGANLTSEPDNPDRYWRQQFSVHFPSTNYANDSIDWNGRNSGTWQMLRVSAPGLRNNTQQWLTFESWYPPYYHSTLTGQSWMVFENFMVEYKPLGPVDTTPPGPVSDFAAVAGPAGIVLTWQNPSDADFTGTRIRYRTDVYPAGPQDGTLLADDPGSPGAADSITHSVPADGQTYYYAAFAYDASTNFAPARTAIGTMPVLAPGDFDGDGDVDLEDFAHLQICLSGFNIPQTDAGCANARLDGDNDVDQTDVELFRDCLSGPNVPPIPGCGMD